MSKFDNISNKALVALIDNWVKSERDRCILKRRLIDGISYDALSEEFNLSYDRVKQIVYKQQNVIFDHIPEIEVINGEVWYAVTP